MNKQTILGWAAAVAMLILLAGCAPAVSAPTSTPTPETVTVTLTDFKIEASTTTFEVGKTYRFVVTNEGTLNHEFMILPPTEDTSMMATEEGMNMGDEGMDMDQMHEIALVVVVIEEDQLPPGTTQTVEFTFKDPAGSGELEMACHTPGHYDAGMKESITVTE